MGLVFHHPVPHSDDPFENSKEFYYHSQHIPTGSVTEEKIHCRSLCALYELLNHWNNYTLWKYWYSGTRKPENS